MASSLEGVDQLSDVVKPTYKEQSYNQLDSVLINGGWERSIRIIESERQCLSRSGTSRIEKRFYNFPSKLTENDGELILDSIVSTSKWRLSCKFFAENIATRNYENREVNEIPKGKTLKRLESGPNGELSIEGIHMDRLNLWQYVQLSNLLSKMGALIRTMVISMLKILLLKI